MKNIFKKAVVLFLFTFVITSALALTATLPVLAEGVDVWGEDTGNSAGAAVITDATGLGEKDPREIAASIINVILGFLGIIAVVIILLGGFKWMTAGGNEDKVGEAKKLITAGIIGLVIILGAFSIATFVLNQLSNATAS